VDASILAEVSEVSEAEVVEAAEAAEAAQERTSAPSRPNLRHNHSHSCRPSPSRHMRVPGGLRLMDLMRTVLLLLP